MSEQTSETLGPPGKPETMISWRRVALALLLATASQPLATAYAQTYSIDWHRLAGGGGASTGAVYAVNGTIGQHDAGGVLTNRSYSMTGGFWVLPVAVQTAGAPTLRIVPGTPGFAVVSWAPATPGFVLQENPNLAATNWVNSPGSASSPVTVPATSPAKFYRLWKP